MKREVANNFIVVSILIVAIGFIFMNSSFNFTGNAILSEYVNQSACEVAGYSWEDLTEQNCTPLEGCVQCESGCVSEYIETLCETGCVTEISEVQCESGCVEDYTETLCESGCQENCEEGDSGCVQCESGCVEDYTETLCETGCVIETTEVLCESGCVEDYTETLCETGCQETCEECEEIIIGGQCVGDICGADNLDLCVDQESCSSIGKYWYDESCNSEEQCIADTCNSLNYECGSVDDGCGNTLECGGCISGQTCSSGTCKSEETSTTSSSSSSSQTSVSKFTTNVVKTTCSSDWKCSEWTECLDGIQTRSCEDLNNCGSEEGKPNLSQSCEMPETCEDGMKNQNEKGIDCGGICDKKCSVFTIIGSVIEGPVESSKEFLVKNKVVALISLGSFVLAIGGVFGLRFFLKRKGSKSLSSKQIAKKIWKVTKV